MDQVGTARKRDRKRARERETNGTMKEEKLISQ